MRNIFTTVLSCLIFSLSIQAQHSKLPISLLEQTVNELKNDSRGPYKRIRWFCKDGSIREPKDPCPDSTGGGIQHASYKEDVIRLGNNYHIYFGDILAYTDKIDFWDKENNQSRLIQYQLSKYLASVDDGWITRKSRYYRGAIQSEDEEAWGVEFYRWLLKDNSTINKHYYLIKQSLRDIPHNGDTNIAQLVRSESKVIAEEMPNFMDIRIKIHGRPDVTDIDLVNNYVVKNKSKLSSEQLNKLNKLQKAMIEFYSPINFEELKQKMSGLTTNNNLTKRVNEFIKEQENTNNEEEQLGNISELLCEIRTEISSINNVNDKLLLLDFSNDLEDLFIKSAQNWKPKQLSELLEKIYVLSEATAGSGLVENWEWQQIEPNLIGILSEQKISLTDLNEYLRLSRGIVEWSVSRVKSDYGTVVNTYSDFEPKALGFIDDRIRSSMVLSLGESVSELANYLAVKTKLSNKVMDIKNSGAIRGLNPGYALGELIVVKGSSENITVNASNIYIFDKPPSDLKPVAGIMTVSEGNLVSHVQLLARNLGIPNAALSDENLEDLYKYNGKRIFYAVTNKGTVQVKLESDMTPVERELFVKKERTNSKIKVPVGEIRLDVSEVLNMRNVNATDSGKLCGPKAANLGQLKSMFPEHVVEGLIIPFGIFKSHMDQPMPGKNISYWNFLSNTFASAEAMRNKDVDESKIEDYLLSQLKELEEAILKMHLDSKFISQLQNQFKNVFGSSIGNVPVFLRSDTNMEDLKEFTGAGLNLTLFNILDEQKIIEGIKRVWASPYTDRSFKWRQKYLLNPENVYPSILIIPSVDVEYSGVMITKGINVGGDNDLTVAFSRGAGGAVDGQSAETWLLKQESSLLLAPARQIDYLRLPKHGGTITHTTTFEENILNQKNKNSIRKVAKDIREKLTENEYKGAYDVELGFKNDKLWLFQIRPFVENKQAKGSEYLQSITPKVDYSQQVNITEKIL